MKKLFLFFSFLFFLGITSRVWGVDFPKREPALFSDPGFSQPTHNFSCGQMVYIRVITSGGGEKKNELRILDSEKREIKRMSLARNGNGPYNYTASFTAPQAPGIYYVDIKIEGEGSSFASQENINVGEGQGPSSVLSEAESVVVQGNHQTPILTPVASPTEKPQEEVPPPLAEKPRHFVFRLIDFFRRWFFRLTGLGNFILQDGA